MSGIHPSRSSRYRQFPLRFVRWKNSRHELQMLREKVFVHECRLSARSEFDSEEARSLHVVIYDPGRHAVATGRLTPGGDIGHMAVALSHRHQGLGRRILAQLLKLARRQGLAQVTVCCPLTACQFFARHGFCNHSLVYMRDGIPHRQMRIGLPPHAPLQAAPEQATAQATADNPDQE